MNTQTKFLTNKDDITAWLDKHGVRNYTLVANDKYGWVVDTKSEVEFYCMELETIPVKFNKVNGNFGFEGNEITDLDFAPISCASFDCDGNNLSSLKGAPASVDGNFFCSKNKLTSLEGGPSFVHYDYYCDENNLQTLKGAPQYVGNAFICSNNIGLKSLKYCPKDIQGILIANNCSLEGLKYLPEKILLDKINIDKNALLGDKQKIKSFEELKRLAAIENKVIKEQKMLGKGLGKMANTANQKLGAKKIKI